MHGILRWLDSIISINHTEEHQKYLGRLNRNPHEKHLNVHETWAEMTLVLLTKVQQLEIEATGPR